MSNRQRRRLHTSSRGGCTACKRRHVKCNEAGPPCGRCMVRGESCEYGSVATSSLPSSTNTSNNDNTVDPFTSSSQGSASTAQSLSSAKYCQVVFSENRHLLELQLMHRWTASTYKSCCTPGSDDDEVWQSWVPQLAIKYDYLLYGLWSLTAFEIAKLGLAQSQTDNQRFIESATEYHGSALSSFRLQLQISVINSDNIDAAVCMSLMLLVLAFASAQARAASSPDHGSDGMVQTVLTHVDLLRGCLPIVNSQQDYLAQNPYIQKIKPFQDLPKVPLDPRVDEALVKLAELNDKRILSSIRDTDQRRIQQVEYWEACKSALGLLRTLYEKCVDEYTRGYALGWLNMAGDGYVQAVKVGDDVALLMLMYWGVLVELCGQQVWWADQFGSSLVAEIAHRPQFEDADAVTKDLILRAQQMQVESPR
ncbi:hypothetical protein G7046_g7967 [Stylonectria norvegica]|nr:hypothetical protein G7046_g7967 [Stylonectria norvegica]